MEQTICIIKEYKEIDEKGYFILIEKSSSTEYMLPLNQLYNDKLLINHEYKFYKQYNPKFEKYFLIQEHSFYKLNSTYEFSILRIDYFENNQGIKLAYFIIEDKDKNEISVKAQKWQLESSWSKKVLNCKIVGYKKNKLVLQNNDYYNPHYEIGKEYDFKFKEFSSYKCNDIDVESIIVEDLSGNLINVKALKWQIENIWKFETLKCEVLRLNSIGVPHLLNKDFRHPIFKIGNVYKFKVVSQKYKVDNKNINKKYHIFELLGEDNCLHETNILPGQINKIKENDIIDCEVISIGFSIRLKQANIKDPYFAFIEDIVKDEKLITKYFKKAITESDNLDCEELNEQYSTQSAFWVFTFCSKILTRYFNEFLERIDYKSSKEIAFLIITFEEWIINKGIISSFPNDNAKKLAQIKAKEQLDKYKIIQKSLEILDSRKFSNYFEVNDGEISKYNIAELYYIFSFSDIRFIDERLFIPYLNSALNFISVNEYNIYYFNLLDKSISVKKHFYYDNRYEKQFNLTSQSNKLFDSLESQNKYFCLSYCQYLINLKHGTINRANYLLGKMLRQFFYVVDSFELKEKLLYNSYYFQSVNIDNKLDCPFYYNNQLELKVESLIDNPNCCSSNETDWDLIKKSTNEHSIIKVNVVNKEFNGFVVEFNSIKGFLPFNHITDKSLKYYSYSDIDYTINAECILFSEEFNFFIVKQLNQDNKNYLSSNNRTNKASIGEVIEGRVKNLTEFGVFIITPYGDSLLHITNISTHFWDLDKLQRYFKIGDKVYAVISKINGTKVEVSFSDLKNTKYENYYYEFINRIDFGEFFNSDSYLLDDENIEINYSQSNQLEKAFCFEQYAVLKRNFNEKIQYLRIAKQFFSSINHARSYLINIYTNYFKILILLDEAIRNFDSNKIQKIKDEASEIIQKIERKTLEAFPDTENLIFFLNILSLFNETSDESIEQLYKLQNKYSLESDKRNLKTIAKIALSNNLIISESDEYSDYTRKNLKLLKSYLDNGVLSLNESESDKLERELKEKLQYWLGKIKENESETIEFKSSFKTPMPDENALKEKERLLKLLETVSKKDGILKSIDKIDGELASKAVIHSALKTLCAFANTNGGNLLIGVRDNLTISGLETDYMSLKNKKDRDGFGLYFDNKIKEYFDESFSSLLSREYIKTQNGDILIVNVKPSIEPIFLLKDEEGNNSEELFVRELTSTKEIKNKKELVKFVKQKQVEQFKSKLDVEI